MTVLIAVVTTVAITGTNNDMIQSARSIFSPVAGVPVWVSANPPDSFPTDALPQGISEQVAAVPGVGRVTEGAFGFAEVGRTRVMLDGFSPGSADPLYRALDEQVRNQVLGGRGVVLSQNLGKVLHVRVGPDTVEDLDPVETRHHDVEDEEVGSHLSHGLEHERAVWDDHCLVGCLVVDGISEKSCDRLVVLTDDDDPLPLFHVGGIYRMLCQR